MRRLARYVFTLCLIASLLLLALWLTSRAAPLSGEFGFRGGTRWGLEVSGGKLAVDDEPQLRLDQEAARSVAERRVEVAQLRHLAAHAAMLKLAAQAGGGGGASDAKRKLREAHRVEVMRLHELGIAQSTLSSPPKPRPAGRHAVHLLAAGVLTGVPPLAWLAGRIAPAARRRRRTARGLCPDCGYDLRASPGRCPECGSAARSSASK